MKFGRIFFRKASYASIDGVGFLLPWHTFKMVAMISACHSLLHAAPTASWARVALFAHGIYYSSWSIVHLPLLLLRS